MLMSGYLTYEYGWDVLSTQIGTEIQQKIIDLTMLIAKHLLNNNTSCIKRFSLLLKNRRLLDNPPHAEASNYDRQAREK